MSHMGHVDDTNDETPLLQANDMSRKPTLLPTSQVLVICSERLCDVITLSSISPYINQLISELPIIGGDTRRVGYYTGIIMSMYFVAEAITVLQWNRLSDRIGRKPVFLTGILGTALSITLFGLSRSFLALSLCRCLSGALNGNVGVVKSILAEITDETNVARGFSLLPLVAAIGQIIGPSMGGILSRPQDRWPGLFSHHFWSEYPYFLPCLVAAAICLVQSAITALFLKETVGQTSSSRSVAIPSMEIEQPLPMLSLLTRPVLTSVVNYAMLALLDMAALALIPLVWSTPIELGGLGMSPASIGLWISVYGSASAVFQYALFPRVVARFGPRRVVTSGFASFSMTYVLFPLENLCVRNAASGATRGIVWLLIILQLLSISISDMAFSAVFMYISSAAPNKQSLGATNGLAQTVVSIQRTIGPAAATALFAFSLENNIMGGNFAYVVLILLVIIGLFAAVQLPSSTWGQNDNES